MSKMRGTHILICPFCTPYSPMWQPRDINNGIPLTCSDLGDLATYALRKPKYSITYKVTGYDWLSNLSKSNIGSSEPHKPTPRTPIKRTMEPSVVYKINTWGKKKGLEKKKIHISPLYITNQSRNRTTTNF